MDQFEKTVVNPNISLNNFEVKIREPEKNDIDTNVVAQNIPTEIAGKNYKAYFLLAILFSVLIYQITVIL
jgi:hypothetical protein